MLLYLRKCFIKKRNYNCYYYNIWSICIYDIWYMVYDIWYMIYDKYIIYAQYTENIYLRKYD